MKTIYDRTRMLVGSENLNRIKEKSVIAFGVGGVGGFVIETIVRAGIGKIAMIDFDTVDITNINRQIIALHSTIGRHKTEVMGERIKDINPDAQVKIFTEKLSAENIEDFNLGEYDYIVDAIDDIPAKLLLIQKAKSMNIPIISSMGVGNKFDPSQLKIADIKNKLQAELPEYMIPPYIMQIDELPLTGNGKLDRKKLPEIISTIIAEYEAPRNEIEENIIKVFEEILNVERIGINDNFFDLGGDSIKAMRAVTKINKNGYTLNVSDVMKNPVVKHIANNIIIEI